MLAATVSGIDMIVNVTAAKNAGGPLCLFPGGVSGLGGMEIPGPAGQTRLRATGNPRRTRTGYCLAQQRH
jgi:hypothetical protein